MERRTWRPPLQSFGDVGRESGRSPAFTFGHQRTLRLVALKQTFEAILARCSSHVDTVAVLAQGRAMAPGRRYSGSPAIPSPSYSRARFATMTIGRDRESLRAENGLESAAAGHC